MSVEVWLSCTRKGMGNEQMRVAICDAHVHLM